MSRFNQFCHTAHCSCKQSQHRPLKVVLEIYDFLGVGHKYCKIGPQLFPTTLHLGIYISNLCHLQLKTWPEQLLDYVPLDIALPGSADRNS